MSSFNHLNLAQFYTAEEFVDYIYFLIDNVNDPEQTKDDLLDIIEELQKMIKFFSTNSHYNPELSGLIALCNDFIDIFNYAEELEQKRDILLCSSQLPKNYVDFIIDCEDANESLADAFTSLSEAVETKTITTRKNWRHWRTSIMPTFW
jgi:hypothetical protein